MQDLYFIYATAGVIVLYFVAQLARREFDPFAPVWLFLVGYIQLYVIQAYMSHDWAVEVRGSELVWQANFRVFWALLWFMAVYHFGVGRLIAGALPRPPQSWSPTLVMVLSPPLILWGLFCAGITISGGEESQGSQADGLALFRSFPFLMMVAAVLLIVTGRTTRAPRPKFLTAGLVIAALYVLIWMFNGKRSHSLIGVLATVAAFYISRLERPSWPVLCATAFAGALVVTIAIGWRGNLNYDRSFSGFAQYLGDFNPAKILDNINVTHEDGGDETFKTFETEEYGGYLLMMDTVPHKSRYDYGSSYLRVISTFIPRIIWPSKPLYGRAEWVSAWIAGSELERDEEFTGPAIGILAPAS